MFSRVDLQKAFLHSLFNSLKKVIFAKPSGDSSKTQIKCDRIKFSLKLPAGRGEGIQYFDVLFQKLWLFRHCSMQNSSLKLKV